MSAALNNFMLLLLALTNDVSVDLLRDQHSAPVTQPDEKRRISP
jgi:hypothetical protein